MPAMGFGIDYGCYAPMYLQAELPTISPPAGFWQPLRRHRLTIASNNSAKADYTSEQKTALEKQRLYG